MSAVTETWTRKQFDVECVRVTEENIIDVTKWCGGEIKYSTSNRHYASGSNRYIRFEVTPGNKPTFANAHVGDWVLFSGDRFKHYRDKAFSTAYSKKKSLVPEIREILRTALSVECELVEDQHRVAEYYTSIIAQLIKGE